MDSRTARQSAFVVGVLVVDQRSGDESRSCTVCAFWNIRLCSIGRGSSFDPDFAPVTSDCCNTLFWGQVLGIRQQFLAVLECSRGPCPSDLRRCTVAAIRQDRRHPGSSGRSSTSRTMSGEMRRDQSPPSARPTSSLPPCAADTFPKHCQATLKSGSDAS